MSEAVVDLIADMRTLVTNKASPDQHVKNISVQYVERIIKVFVQNDKIILELF